MKIGDKVIIKQLSRKKFSTMQNKLWFCSYEDYLERRKKFFNKIGKIIYISRLEPNFKVKVKRVKECKHFYKKELVLLKNKITEKQLKKYGKYEIYVFQNKECFFIKKI